MKLLISKVSKYPSPSAVPQLDPFGRRGDYRRGYWDTLDQNPIALHANKKQTAVLQQPGHYPCLPRHTQAHKQCSSHLTYSVGATVSMLCCSKHQSSKGFITHPSHQARVIKNSLAGILLTTQNHYLCVCLIRFFISFHNPVHLSLEHDMNYSGISAW